MKPSRHLVGRQLEQITPNWFAIFALASWPVVALWLYYARPVNQATLWTILGAQLLLPVGTAIKFEGIPQFDKISIPTLAALVACLLLRRQFRIWDGIGFPVMILMLMFLIGPFVTAELNGDPIVLPNVVLPAVSYYDAFSAFVGQFLSLIAFLLGRELLRDSNDNTEILRILVIAGLLYSLLMLFELRMSPQLHNWFYGYTTSWSTEARGLGFRPVVFMGNGLLVAFFVMTTVIAATALWRTRSRVLSLPPAAVTFYLGVILALCQTLGALVYSGVLVPLIKFAKPLLQIRVALLLVTIALLYPMLRTADLIPTKYMIDIAELISANRAASLKVRLDQEQMLLERATQRFFLGWGRWGRSRVFDEETGQDVSLTDGRWIITFGQFGLLGFLAEFGLLTLPVFRAASALRFTKSMHDGVHLAALALIAAVNVIDQLPNSSISPWSWLVAGALLGRTETLRKFPNFTRTNQGRELTTPANTL